MEKKARKIVIERYNKRVRRHGFNPRSLGWPKGRQEVRFTILTDIGITDGDSVLDVGCGFGDYARFLGYRNLEVSYQGCDINEEIVALAREQDGSLGLEVRDIEETPFPEASFDWVISSGLFEFLSHGGDRRQMAWVKRILGQMVRTSRRGVAADFLSSHVDYRDEGNFYANPAEVWSASTALSRRVALRHDYMPFEFTVYIYKDDTINERNVFAPFDATLDENLKREFAAS